MAANDKHRWFAMQVVRRLRTAGYEAYWAGGCVRDIRLGRTPVDFDIATSARPEYVRKLFGHNRTLAIGASFGVIIVLGDRHSGQVEVATFRSDGAYIDGRRPATVHFSSAEKDAHRRDFTINGMFYDPLKSCVIDYVNGQRDIDNQVVRAIGTPSDRMAEDKLRMLRAVRFAASLDFQLQADTADAVRAMAPEIHVVSAERIAQELRRMLVDIHRRRAIELAIEVGILPEIFPELQPVIADNDRLPRTLQTLEELQSTSFELAFAVLLSSIGSEKSRLRQVRGICNRLKLSNDERDTICWLVEHQHALRGAPKLEPAGIKRLLSEKHIDPLLEQTRATAVASGEAPSDFDYCEAYLRTTPDGEINPPPLITGDDLIAAGFQPGPHFAPLLEAARDAQLNGQISTHDEAIQLVRFLTEPDPTA